MCKTSDEGSRNSIFLIASIIITTVSITPRISDHTKQNRDWTQWSPSHLNPEVLLQTTTRMTGNGSCIFKDFFSPPLKANDAATADLWDTLGNLVSSHFLMNFHEGIRFCLG